MSFQSNRPTGTLRVTPGIQVNDKPVPALPNDAEEDEKQVRMIEEAYRSTYQPVALSKGQATADKIGAFFVHVFWVTRKLIP